MEEIIINAKKYRLLVKLLMPVTALLMIIIFVFLPIKFVNAALSREAQDKGKEVEKIFDINLFDWI